ncbi:hypothetical protein COW36_15600 [bacterium (Candidatus Blackallbacteria) CG17_big_fil_post_rev_8_21_14_2_50_48_46]|uniref:Uncharacterized protein n=1 Tax=bacterium (Candidatus Blackallbacteria) CG17_big_fil_post_rev_8_21_14_2_50_48_46 TaxID=2014261 RepID=A0A2M7G2M6_9BACT|nr:MAG: hypothetical protein COW64_07635 [bacterium (Candidatus Blackallbacteria) CG18_big_fil_WC_8_21_14_2_50_49_26]PIW15893.1 MAG: hypothetical protein COW36_15600 [bacterium (Candidatus Blackallbacteria) CG17_big_fil_post_rev_8_21_14_2_50_48_46]PIW48642.1 MAG: hypothetical protein COW20_08570 [bacterium (Candidatus Blackallbacteria) CG13_big_fil_rev_8_21_14_2_50_49_14]
MKQKIVFEKHGLDFKNYPFKFGRLAESEHVSSTEIAEIWAHLYPPCLALKSRELLFVPAPEKEALLNWGQNHGLKPVERPDLWETLCNPCLDTVYSPSIAAHDLQQLQEAGFSEQEVESIRAKISPALLAYNALLWDWTYLGLYDVLESRRFAWPFRLTSEFYFWAMQIALRVLPVND